MLQNLARLVVAAFVLLLAQATAEAATPPGFAAKADAVVARYVAAQRFSGVVLVADRGQPILRRGYGMANHELNAPATPETVFRIASTTKQITAAAVMQLVEAGQVELDDPISRYIGDTPAAWSAVTVRQLLNHTSGIPDYIQTSGFVRVRSRLEHRPEELVALVRDQPVQFPAGTQFRYSNTGYVLLGLLIERVSGLSYSDYLAKHVFAPLGLRDLAYDDPVAIVPNRASGYELTPDGLQNALPVASSSTYASGALRSTADDLLAWDLALHGGKLVSPASVAAMFTDNGHGYGLGAYVETRGGRRLWSHGGNLPGFNSALERYPDEGLTIVVLSNLGGGSAERIARELADVYFGSAQTPSHRR